MEAHLHEEFKLWSFVVLYQSQSRMQGGKREESNKKLKRTATVGHISSTSWSPFHAYYILFRISGSRESNASNGAWIGAETKKLWLFEDNCIKLCEISQLRNGLWNEIHLRKFARCFAAAKPTFGTRVPFRSPCLHLHSYEPRCEITSKLRMKLQIISKLRNHIQVVKWQIQLAKSKFKLGKWTIQHAKSTCAISDICYRLS